MASSSRSAGQPAGIHDLPTEVGPLNRHHHLLGDPLGRRKHCAQALMAAHHIGQRRPQRLGIQAPSQPQRHRHVVNRRRPLQLVQEPQPGLGKRQRHHRRPLTGHQRLQPTPIGTNPGRQLGHRGRLEQRAHRKSGIQTGIDRGDHPHRRQRIPTQLEERVVDPDPLQARAPGRRYRPGSPRSEWPGRGNDRHPGIPVPAGRGCRVCR